MLNKIKIKLLKARKEQDSLLKSVLSYLIAEIQNKEIALRGRSEQLTDEHIVEIINKQIKQREESIEQYKNGNRDDLVANETSEKEALENLLKELSA